MVDQFTTQLVTPSSASSLDQLIQPNLVGDGDDIDAYFLTGEESSARIECVTKLAFQRQNCGRVVELGGEERAARFFALCEVRAHEFV